MNVLYFVLFLLALVCFLASAGGATFRWNLTALGLALFVSVFMLQQLTRVS